MLLLAQNSFVNENHKQANDVQNKYATQKNKALIFAVFHAFLQFSSVESNYNNGKNHVVHTIEGEYLIILIKLNTNHLVI